MMHAGNSVWIEDDKQLALIQELVFLCFSLLKEEWLVLYK